MPGSFDNVVLAYQHPYIATYLEDNTIYKRYGHGLCTDSGVQRYSGGILRSRS